METIMSIMNSPLPCILRRLYLGAGGGGRSKINRGSIKYSIFWPPIIIPQSNFIKAWPRPWQPQLQCHNYTDSLSIKLHILHQLSPVLQMEKAKMYCSLYFCHFLAEKIERPGKNIQIIMYDCNICILWIKTLIWKLFCAILLKNTNKLSSSSICLLLRIS